MSSQPRPPLIYKLVALLPKGVVQSLGVLRYRFPVLGNMFRKAVGEQAVGTIAHGPAQGLLLDTSGGAIGHLLGTTDIEEQEVLAGLLKPGAVLFDIGANIGAYAIMAARVVGKTGHVYAFEPFPESAEAVRRNGALNQFENITVVEEAVSNTVGTVTFGMGPSAATNRIVRSEREAETKGAITVPVTTVDAFVGDDPAKLPTVLLLDVEQAEIDVLRGAQKTIEKARPAILVEVHWMGKDFTDYVEQSIVPLGYTATTLDNKPLPTDIIRYHALLLPKEMAQTA